MGFEIPLTPGQRPWNMRKKREIEEERTKLLTEANKSFFHRHIVLPCHQISIKASIISNTIMP